MRVEVTNIKEALKYIVAAELEQNILMKKSIDLLKERERVNKEIDELKNDVNSLITKYMDDLTNENLLRSIVTGTIGHESKKYFLEIEIGQHYAQRNRSHKVEISELSNFKVIN